MRLQTRCLLTSSIVHGALLLLVVVAPAFRSPEKDLLIIEQPLELVPSAMLERALAPGPIARNPEPEAKPPEQPREVEAPKPPVQRPAPQPRPRVETPREDPAPKVETPKKEQPRKEPPKKETPAPKPTPKFDFNKVQKVKPTPAPQKATKAPSRPDPLKSLDRQFERAAGALASTTERKAPTVRISGGGDHASANAWAVRNTYDSAWITPAGVHDSAATTEVEVVIAGDGSVISARVTRPSGIGALDRSVEEALRKVQRIQPFQAFDRGERITFIIGFNLQSKGRI